MNVTRTSRPARRRFWKTSSSICSKDCISQTGEENLCLAGGVAFNSVMNGRIINESPFKRVFIQPAAGDAGCSLGAAFLTHNTILKNQRVFEMDHAYWGPRFSNEECAGALGEFGLKFETSAG